jgi:hypothetical protein
MVWVQPGMLVLDKYSTSGGLPKNSMRPPDLKAKTDWSIRKFAALARAVS